jgi:hypothetical protein
MNFYSPHTEYCVKANDNGPESIVGYVCFCVDYIGRSADTNENIEIFDKFLIEFQQLEDDMVKELVNFEELSKSYSKKSLYHPQSSFNPFSLFTDPIGLKKMSEQIPEVVNVINDKLPDTGERKAFLEFLTSFSSKIPSTDTIKLGSNTLESASKFVSSISKLHPSVLISIASAWYSHDRSWISFSFFVACAIYFVLKVPEQLGFLLNLYMKLGESIPLVPDINMESISPQMSDATLEVAGTIIAGSLIGLVSGSSKLSTGAIVLMFVKDFSRTRLGMVEIAKLVISFIEKIVNLVRESFLDLPSLKFIDSCSEEIDSFSKDVRNYSYRFNRGTLPVNDDTYSSVLCLLGVGKQLLKSIPKDKYTDASLRLIHEDCNNLRKIVLDLERCDITLRGLHQEPVGILMSGGPGVAKSVSTLYLSHIVCRDSLSDEEKIEFDLNPSQFIFSRKQENVFFDTLTNRARVFIYDDLLQARDVAGNPACEAMELIRVLNTEEYSAHMAHLENKGNVYIRPKYVIANTNQPNLCSNAIVSTIAMKRRFDLSYVVVPKHEYTRDEDLNNDLWNRKIDINKLPIGRINDNDDVDLKGSDVTDLRPEHLLYYEHDLMTGVIGNPISFEEVVRLARAKELVKRKRFALHKQNFRTLVSKYARIYDIKADEEVCPDDYSFDPSTELQSSSDESSDVVSCDSCELDDDKLMAFEILITMKPDYLSYLKTHLPSGHKSDIYSVSLAMIEEFGYDKAFDLVENDVMLSPKFKFKSYSKPRLAVRVFESVQFYVQKFLDILPSWQSIKDLFTFDKDAIISIISFIAGSSILVFLAKWLYSWWTGKEVPQSFGFSDKMRVQKVHPSFVKNSQAIKSFISAHPQYSEDSSGIDLITSIVRRNCFRFEIFTEESEWNNLGTITFISGRIGIIPYHFIVKLMQGVEIDRSRLKRHVRIGHGKEDNDPGLLFTVEEILMGHQTGKLQCNDLVLVELPKRFPERQNIVDRFALERDLDFNSVNLEIMLPVINKGRGFYFGKGRRFQAVIGIDKMPGYDYHIERSYTYDLPTQPGDCGALMCVLNPSLQKRKIFGIHVAGHDHRGDGFAGVVVQEDLLEDLKLFPDQIVCEEPVLASPQSTDLDAPVRFEILGRTPLVPMRNTNTGIVRSKMYGSLGEVNLKPAMLRSTYLSGTLVDPLLNAQRKYCKPDVLFDFDLMNRCCREYFSYCEWNSTFTVIPRIFTLDEAIFGLEYDVDFGSVSSSTSSGWPMNVSSVRDLKKELFSYEYGSVEQNIVRDLISIKTNEIITKARNGIRMFHVFTDNLKDELREIDKYNKGSTRLFSGSPFEYLLVFRQYFGAFNLWFMKNRIANGSAIGVNPYSSEWNAIAKRLLAKSDSNIGAGDYSGFDGSQKPIVHLAILDSINRWYDDGADNCKIRSILWMEIYNSRHICDGVIYEWFSGLGSGHAFTITVNTIYGHINSRYAFHRAVGSSIGYNDNVYAITLGDDIVYSVTDKFKVLFNDITFSKFVFEMGMTYTNESKTGELIAGRSINEVEFLKRGFVFDPGEGLWIAPLRIQSILKMVDWTKKKHKNAIVAQNVLTAIKELSLHDKEVFDKYSVKIIKAFQKHYPYLHTSEPLDMDFGYRRTQVLGTTMFY